MYAIASACPRCLGRWFSLGPPRANSWSRDALGESLLLCSLSTTCDCVLLKVETGMRGQSNGSNFAVRAELAARRIKKAQRITPCPFDLLSYRLIEFRSRFAATCCQTNQTDQHCSGSAWLRNGVRWDNCLKGNIGSREALLKIRSGISRN